MSTAFVEATLSQIFKERKDDEYVGGLPFYGRRLLKNAAWAGAALSVLYIIYAFLCFPAQGFNTISAVGAIAGVFTGTVIETNSSLYRISFAVLIVATAIISFGGSKSHKVTDLLVPVMAVIYILTVVLLIVFNIPRDPVVSDSLLRGIPSGSSLRRSVRHRIKPGHQARLDVK